MTDLSFLFQKPQAQGVGAGYEAGMQDYYKQQELANQQAYADEARFRTKRGEALLDTDLARAKWETSPEMQQAGLAHTQAQTGLYSAQAQEALQKMTTQDMANMHQGVVSLVTQGVQMALRGANGKEIVNSLEAELIQKMQNADGQAKVGYENQLRKLRGDAASSGMLDWSPQEVVTNGTNFLKKMSEYSPERMLQDAKNAARLQEQRIIASSRGRAADKLNIQQRLTEISQLIGNYSKNSPEYKKLEDEANYLKKFIPGLQGVKNYIETDQGRVYITGSEKGESGNTNKSETSVSNW